MRVLGSTRSIPALQYVATTFATTSFGVWKWQQDAVGWGTRYALPAAIGDGYQAEFSPDNNYIVVSATDAGQGLVRMFPFSFNGIGTMVSGGFVSSPNADGLGVAWHPDQDAILFGVGYTDPPTMRAIKWTGTAWGTTYSQPISEPGDGVFATKFSFDGAYAFASDGFSPYIFAYPWTQASGFGTKKANPATLPTGAVSSIDTQEEEVVLALQTSPYVSAYPFISSWGTKYTNPATLPTGLGLDVSFSGTGHVAVAHQTSPYVAAYPFSGGFGTKYANPATLPPGNAGGIDFSPDQKNIVVGTGGDTPFMQMYGWSSGWGTKYANPAVLPSSGNGTTRFSNL